MDSKKKFYEIPSAELVEVQVEKGFAGSSTGTGEGWNGTDI